MISQRGFTQLSEHSDRYCPRFEATAIAFEQRHSNESIHRVTTPTLSRFYVRLVAP